MSVFARGLRLLASLSSAGDGILGRDSYLPGARRPDPDTAALHERLTRLTSLPRDPDPGHDGLARAAALMAGLFEEVGLRVERDRFVAGGCHTENVLGHHGTPGPGARIVMGHYDAVPRTPGADDNASGAIGLVAIAERLRGSSTATPVSFLATTLEECGMHGSVRQARLARTAGVAGVIDLEMIAYTARRQSLPRGVRARTRGDFLAIVANEPSAFLGEALMATARRTAIDLPIELIVLRGRGTDLPISRLSDHAPFWDQDLPAVMLTDTAFLRNPHYHAPTDQVSTLDLGFMSRVCDLVADYLRAP